MCICHSGHGESEDIFLEETVDTLDNTELFNLHKAKKKNVKIKHSYGGLQQAMCYPRDEQRDL